MTYSVILFDLDGTLIDTNELIIESFLYTFQKHGLDLTMEDVLPVMGVPLREQMRMFDADQADEMVLTYRRHNEEHHDQYVKGFADVVEVIQQLHQEGIRMAIVTNKRKATAQLGLAKFGLQNLMDFLITYEDVAEPKPAPDMLLLALEQLQAKPEEALMVGDSQFDILAAQKAGVDSVGVGWSLHLDKLKKHRPTYVIQNMRELATIVKGGAPE